VGRTWPQEAVEDNPADIRCLIRLRRMLERPLNRVDEVLPRWPHLSVLFRLVLLEGVGRRPDL
jgi:hypothetical protein